ncbi:hypothetical protein SDJN02_14920, partial [Cucurbita argyrosperma subsp. argyrosperma]
MPGFGCLMDEFAPLSANFVLWVLDGGHRPAEPEREASVKSGRDLKGIVTEEWVVPGLPFYRHLSVAAPPAFISTPLSLSADLRFAVVRLSRRGFFFVRLSSAKP